MLFACLKRLTLLSLAMILAAPLLAEEKKAEKKGNDTTKAVDRKDKGWQNRHAKFLERAKKGDVNVLFLGDSITHAWEGQAAWKKHFEPLKAANFGISGDRTQHVLWRITEGKELEGINPKAAVIMIGTNNMSSNSSEEIADGVAAIVSTLRKARPDTKILLLGIFPRSPKATDKVRDKIKETNARLAKLDDGKSVVYLDIGSKFLASDGELTKEIMPDFLHLSPKGYEIWAEAITPPLEKLLK